MACLYITEQHAILRKTGDRVIVEKDGEVIMEIPCFKLDAVLLYGNVQFTTQAAVELLQHGIEDGIGFDPFIGFFHAVDYGRASLAFDLLEEFRHSLVDRMTMSLLNRGVLKRSDFQSTPEGGLYLDQDGKRRYFTEYAKELTTPFRVDGHDLTFREIFRRQADRLAAAITREEPYESFLFPC
jgi:CRISPR/Cas system-associated endonuclease Cas1